MDLKPGETRHNDHAGLLLFAKSLGSLPQTITPPEPLFQQWLASLFLGALNIEQTKFLNWEDLSQLIGATTRSLALQRTSLKALATPGNQTATCTPPPASPSTSSVATTTKTSAAALSRS